MCKNKTMRKLFYLLPMLVLVSFSSCLSEKEVQSENNEALLREIGQSEAFIKMTTSIQQSRDLYRNMDRERYLAIMEEADLNACDIKEKGMPAALKEVEGAVAYLNVMMEYCEGREAFNKTYPEFWDLPAEVRVRAYEYRNQSIGFEPASVLAKN